MAISDLVTCILSTFGDCNPVDYGGGFVYLRKDRPEDTEPSKTPELEHIEPPIGRGRGETWDCPMCDGSGTGECSSPPDSSDYRNHVHGQAEPCDLESCNGHGPWVCIKCRGTGQDPDLRWEVSTVLVEPYSWVDWPAVADTCDQDPEIYAQAFRDQDPRAMASAIVDAAGHYGWYEFDQYPMRLTATEIGERVRSLESLESCR